jgi:hypothetical protein
VIRGSAPSSCGCGKPPDQYAAGEHQLAAVRRVADVQVSLAVLSRRTSCESTWRVNHGATGLRALEPVAGTRSPPLISASPGKTYQLWVLASRPISTASSSPIRGRGGGIRDPADLPQPIGMAVTIEPDGGAAPTRDEYLVGL